MNKQQLYNQAFDLLYVSDTPEEAQEGLRLIKHLADENYCEALFELSGLYEYGHILEKDNTFAEELIFRAFQNGCKSAASNLAHRYIEKSDWENALKYLRIGAENDEEYSLVKLGQLYEYGGFDGAIKQDWNLSLDFYVRAARACGESYSGLYGNQGKIGAYSIKIKMKNSQEYDIES